MAIASQMNLQEQVNSMNEQIKQILAAQNEMNEKVENQSTRLSMYVPQVQFERAMNRLVRSFEYVLFWDYDRGLEKPLTSPVVNLL